MYNNKPNKIQTEGHCPNLEYINFFYSKFILHPFDISINFSNAVPPVY